MGLHDLQGYQWHWVSFFGCRKPDVFTSDARHTVRGLILTTILLAAGACGSGSAAPARVDLLEQLPSAEIRPVDRPPDALQVVHTAVDGRPELALSAMVPSRVIVRTYIPFRAAFSTSLKVDRGPGGPRPGGVNFRLGISDGRTYELLANRTIGARDASGWMPLRIDLGGYAGWQWSLFYHPSSIRWQIVLNTYSAGAGSEGLRGLWAAPVIEKPRP